MKNTVIFFRYRLGDGDEMSWNFVQINPHGVRRKSRAVAQ